ncbi:MAG: tetratricopeptide repeat protein [Chloroherpetonaceae bacterium]|nr:tetratricopeptide repeat protein [Chloroherpetonaceae bacterium]
MKRIQLTIGFFGLISLLLFAPFSFAAAVDFDEAIEKLLREGKYGEIETLMKARLSQNQNDDEALYYLAIIPIRMGKGPYDEAAQRLEKCISLKPSNANYYHWLGRAYGLKARDAGIFNAVGYLGKIKDAFEKSLELEPNNFEARSEYIQFHGRVPGILGGSFKRAKELAKGFEQYDRVKARLLWAELWGFEEEYGKMKEELNALPIPLPEHAQNHTRQLLRSIGGGLLEREKASDAKDVFLRYIQFFPDEPFGYNGLGRVYYDLGNYSEAIQQFDKAILLDKNIGSQYRLGLIYEKQGEKQKAIQNFEAFLSIARQRDKKQEEDARKRLQTLRSQG